MPTLLCVPIFVEDSGDDPIAAALADAGEAKKKGADLVEFRIDRFFSGSRGDSEDAFAVARLRRLLGESPLPVVLTCRPTWEGGDYDGDDADRVALFEKLCCGTDAPPAYLDVELAAYTRSANLRQKINLCVAHPGQRRGVTTRLILSIHDFEGRPGDLDRRFLAACSEPACAVVKVAWRARSLRDNLELFEIIRASPKPVVALGMGEFGLMSRVLAPKYGGFLTFASLRDQAATAPGQPTIDDLLGLYRFRSIGRETRLYGVIGWPVGHSMSPLIHNAGFGAVGHDGVLVPMPVAASDRDAGASFTSFKATLDALLDEGSLGFSGASVTIPHKENLARYARERFGAGRAVDVGGAANTVFVDGDGAASTNTDAGAVVSLLGERWGDSFTDRRVGVVGAGGVARAITAGLAERGATVVVYNRNIDRAERLAGDVNAAGFGGRVITAELSLLPRGCCHGYVNCTPVGMTGGADALGMSIPVADLRHVDGETVFFDTVYNPVETPMLAAARGRGCRVIDGVEMFVRQAAGQFELWTGEGAPVELFDRLCRERLGVG